MVMCHFVKTTKIVFWISLVFICHIFLCPFRQDREGCFLNKVDMYSYHMLYGYLPFCEDNKGCILGKVGTRNQSEQD